MKCVIVMRPFSALHEELSAIFAGDPEICVILDRRYTERRKVNAHPPDERRSGQDRRQALVSVAAASFSHMEPEP